MAFSTPNYAVSAMKGNSNLDGTPCTIQYDSKTAENIVCTTALGTDNRGKFERDFDFIAIGY